MRRRRTAKTADDLLIQARAMLPHRPSPAEAFRAQQSGSLLIDIRGDDQRHADGLIPGAIVLPRKSLEWRTGIEIVGTDYEGMAEICLFGAIGVVLMMTQLHGKLVRSTTDLLKSTNAVDWQRSLQTPKNLVSRPHFAAQSVTTASGEAY